MDGTDLQRDSGWKEIMVCRHGPVVENHGERICATRNQLLVELVQENQEARQGGGNDKARRDCPSKNQSVLSPRGLSAHAGQHIVAWPLSVWLEPKRKVHLLSELERVKGIEPSSQAWEARILPLDHTR
jgi:hypothetical protein